MRSGESATGAFAFPVETREDIRISDAVGHIDWEKKRRHVSTYSGEIIKLRRSAKRSGD